MHDTQAMTRQQQRITDGHLAYRSRGVTIVISDATSVQPLCRSRVDLSIIGLVTEAVEAEVAVRGVEEDLRNL